MIRAFSVAALVAAGVGALGIGVVSCGSSGSAGSGDAGGDSTTPDTGASDGHGGDVHLGDGAGGEGGVVEGGSGEGGLPGDGGVFHGDGGCFTLGSACTGNGECCSNDCSGGVCAYPPCTSDKSACTANGQCCSQDCGDGGTCTPLSTTCSTLGNACGAGLPACCSGFCVAGACQQPSYCGQTGDACSTGVDCCSGVCTVQAGQQLGLCGAPPTGSASACTPDGVLCSGNAGDGGVVYADGGVPTCGGSCCSRSCAPWGPTGALICQPASGCHIEGDLCTTDSECCGGGGLVTCQINAGSSVGICRSPTGGSDAGNACIPNGDVCKLGNMSCNKDCNCCSGNCETQDTCKQDNLGIPRCTGAACVDAGTTCASSADCCNDNPCVPGPGGVLTCYPYQCVPSCGTCTNSADCCPGESCLNGTCDPCGGGGSLDGGTTGDGGNVPDASGLPPDGGAPPPPDGGCASYGQLCSSSGECCNGVPCTIPPGRCEFSAQ